MSISRLEEEAEIEFVDKEDITVVGSLLFEGSKSFPVILRSQGLEKNEFQPSFALVPDRKSACQQGGKVSYIRSGSEC